MIKVSIFYPTTEGARFDLDYYVKKHIPLCAEKLAPALKSYSVDSGVGGATPKMAAPYIAIGHLYFDDMASYGAAFKAAGAAIMADVPNYTDLRPIVQVSEVVAKG